MRKTRPLPTLGTAMPPGESERLVLVAQVLEATGPGPIDTVTLVDPIGDLPVLWLKVLACPPSSPLPT